MPAIAVVRVRRMTGLRTLLHQLEVAQQVHEGVTSGNPVAKEHALHHQPQLIISDAGIHLADLLHGIHDAHHAEKILLIALALLIVRLFRSVKQAAGILDGEFRLPTKALYRLTPDFFRILMPCSSQMSISVFSARLRSFSN